REGLTLVDFYATWCGPCKMLHPVLEEVEKEVQTVSLKKLDVDEEKKIAKEYGVMSIPTLVLFKNGVEVARNVGFLGKQEMISWIERNR
ncbi:MAG: thioredoxin, partial [Clostridia bacterium]|nr:thioredoxin [Clostridia bacterium]